MKDKYYYCQKKEFINKYQIDIDEKVLKELRKEIIEKCSKITHRNYKTTNEPNYLHDEHIRNYKSKELGMISFNDFFSPDQMEYLVDYDYYEFSILVTVIDDLLKGNTNVIDDLKNPEFLNKYENNKENLKDTNLKEEINKLIEKGLYEEIDELIQTKTADLILKKQEKFVLEKYYVTKINEYIKLTLHDQITTKKLLEIKDFFSSYEPKQNVSNNLVKLLKKDNQKESL